MVDLIQNLQFSYLKSALLYMEGGLISMVMNNAISYNIDYEIVI